MTERRWEEQAVSEIAKQVLSDRLDQQDLEVEVHTDLGKLLQGEADSVSVEAQDLAIQEDIHLQALELQIDDLAINPLSLIFNKLELNRPLKTAARVLVSEADINQLLNSEAFFRQLSPLTLKVNGQTATVELQPPLHLKLPDDQKMIFEGRIVARMAEQTQQAGFTGTLQPWTDQHSVLLETFCFHEGQAMSLEFTTALMQKLTELVKLPFFEYDGSAFRIKSLEVHRGSLTLQIEACLNALARDRQDVEVKS